MGTLRHFSELKTWQEARILNKMVFECLLSNDQIRDWALKDQVNRSAGSVMDNIAEGFGRGGNKEFVQFLSYALGSLAEVESQLTRALDRKYLDETQAYGLEEMTKRLTGMIISFMNYLKKSGIRGPKFSVGEPPGEYKTTNSSHSEHPEPKNPEPKNLEPKNLEPINQDQKPYKP